MNAVPLLLERRTQWTIEQLRPYEGQWVAFSANLDRIVASGADFSTVNRDVELAGVDPKSVWFERIVLNDDWQGGVELE